MRVAAVDPPAGDLGDPDPPDPGLHAALATLSDTDQEVLRLWAWEGLAPAEVAIALDVTPNAANIRLHRAKARLAGALSKATAPCRTQHPRGPGEVT